MAQLGLGLAALGRPGYMTLGHALDVPSSDVEAMKAQTFSVLDAAWGAGVRHLDTARSYGRGEAFLREWLDARAVSGATISSKWGYRYTAQWQRDARLHEVKDHSAQHLARQWEETRATLGPWLDVYQVHSATLESGVLADESVLTALYELRTTGLELGVSVTGPRQAEVVDAAMRVRRDGTLLFTWVQATWNVLEPSVAPALLRAKDQGARVIIKEPLANGLLTSRGAVGGWLETAKERGVAPDALALAAALQQPFADVVLSGAATVEQLSSNLTARAVDATSLEAGRWSIRPQDYWAQRAQLMWT